MIIAMANCSTFSIIAGVKVKTSQSDKSSHYRRNHQRMVNIDYQNHMEINKVLEAYEHHQSKGKATNTMK